MSSVLRDVSQRQSETMYSNEGVYFYSYTKIVQVANSYNAQQQGNIFLFANEIDCAEAIYDLDNYANNNSQYTLGGQTFTDMGKQIKFGVKGGLSDHFTLRLVQLRSLDSHINTIGDGYNTFWVLTDAKTTTGMKNVFASVDYGSVYLQR
jgi:protease II